MKRYEVDGCALPFWYSRFELHTIPTRFVTLSDEFVQWLKDGEFVIPDENVSGKFDTVSEDSDDETEECQDDVEKTEEANNFVDSIPVSRAIEDCGGDAFVKLNWSAPRDAGWIRGGTLKVSSWTDVILLLKSSDRTLHDLEGAYEDCKDSHSHSEVTLVEIPPQCPTLCIREWRALRQQMEFRCFVRNSTFVAISQRHSEVYFPSLTSKELQEEVRTQLKKFVNEVVISKFPLRDFIVDVYITSKPRVVVVDFSPFGSTTNPLLFTWEDLLSLNNDSNNDDSLPILRVRETQVPMVPSVAVGGASFPLELTELGGSGSGGAEGTAELISVLQRVVESQNKGSS